MVSDELHTELRGWWRITETSHWANDGIDDLGPALIAANQHPRWRREAKTRNPMPPPDVFKE